jgi:glycosyltransferase involved in cell wall biosynthesis
MHVLFVHPNFPAQFGPVAARLAATPGNRVTFVSQGRSGLSAGGTPDPGLSSVRQVQYATTGGATAQNHYCSRTFENAVWNTDGVYQAVRTALQGPNGLEPPDLIVGHSGFGSTLFLPELFPRVPVLNLFEYFYRPHHPESDMDFRRDLGWKVPEVNYLRSRCRNAMILLDLHSAAGGYTPTAFQKSCFPAEYQPKIEVVFDGTDRAVFHGHGGALRRPVERTLAGRRGAQGPPVVSYVSRGFESMRGFDLFIRAARLMAREWADVLFFIVGTDRHAYGGDEAHVGADKTFKQWVLRQYPVDERFVFTGALPREELARVLAASDLHVYLTVPFVLSWSLLDAMSSGAVVLASDTAPVREVVRDGENGLLADFFSPEDFARRGIEVLRNPAGFRGLGEAAQRTIQEQYSVEVTLPRLLSLFKRFVG